MAGVLYWMWVRHHLRPGEFWALPHGEQQFLLASTDIELEQMKKQSKGGDKR